MLNLVCCERSERRHDEDTGNDEAHFVQRCPRLGKSVQVEDHHARLHAWSAIQPRNRPGVESNHVVVLFEELRPQERALRPFAAERHDIGGVSSMSVRRASMSTA